MMKLTLVVVCLLVLGQQAAEALPSRDARLLDLLLRALEEDLNTKEKKAAAERPNLEEYVTNNCPKEMKTLAQANLDDGVTPAEMILTLSRSDMYTWAPALNQIAEDMIKGKVDVSEENYYQKVMCAMALIDVLTFRLVIGNPPLCEGEDVSSKSHVYSLASYEACLKEKVADLKKQVADLNGVTDVDDAAADLMRIMLTVGSIRRTSWNIGNIEKIRNENKRSKLFSLEKRLGNIAKRQQETIVQWIKGHCDISNVVWNSPDNSAITAADIQQAAKDAGFEKWWDGLDDIENKKPNGPKAKTVYEKASCSMAPLLGVSNRLMQGGLADVCEGKDVEPADDEALYQCISTDLADLKNAMDAISQMTTVTTTEDCAVQAVRALLSLDRIADGLWFYSLKQ